MGNGLTGRNSRGRHRLATGALRLVEKTTGEWSLTPVTRSTHYVGRVGALALFLGIGGAITGLPVAAADVTGDGNADASASAGTSDSAPSPRHSRGARSESQEPTTDSSVTRRTGRSSVKPNPASAVGRNSHVQRTVTPDLATGISAPDVSAPRASTDSATEALVDASAAPEAVEIGQSIATTDAAPATPVMRTVASRAALSGAGLNPLTWLGGGGDPAAPIATPLAWAALAVSRRELSGGRTAAAPAASVTTAQPASAVSDFLNQPAVVSVFVAAAKQFVLTALDGGSLTAALQTGMQSISSDPVFANFSFFSLLTEPTLPQILGRATGAVITALAGDADVQAAVSDRLGGYIASALGGGAFATGIAGTVADAVVGLLADPAVGSALGGVVNSAVSTLISQPGVMAAIGGVVDDIAAVVDGIAPAATLDTVWDTLRSSTAIQDGVGVALTTGFTTALTNPGLMQALGAAVTDIATGLTSDPVVQNFVGQYVSGFVNYALAGNPLAGQLASALSDAAVGLLADPALAEAVGSLLGGIAGQPAFAGVLADAASQVLTAVFAGAEPLDALDTVWQALQVDSGFATGVAATIAGAVSGLLTDPGLISDLGITATVLVGELAANPEFGTFVSGLVGPLYGDVIVTLLSDPVATERLAELAGTVVSGFLGQPGVTAAVADVAEQFVIALFGGAELSDAAQNALSSLQEAPAIAAGIEWALSELLHGILGDTAVKDVVGQVTERVVIQLVSNSPVPVPVAQAAVDSLLASTAVQSLIADLAVTIASGTPVGELTGTVIQAVIRDPALQRAVGNAVGQGVGALIGDNPIGALVGQVVGVTATLVIGVVSGFTLLFQGLTSVFGAAAVPAGSLLGEQLAGVGVLLV